ncbi:FecR domain-containing protein [Aquitalea magnusonii]|uniref:FecR domain-containing protein n=1 Tax=Aquitalea magnusonii TaxID=332411 RepID=UPI000B5C62F8|nr:FecR domain-containing protein [Aquitalea magnusonii]
MATLTPAILRQAAEWHVLFSAGEASNKDHAAWQQWRAANPLHEEAWQQLASLTDRLQALPAGIGQQLLQQRQGRRRTLRQCVLLLGCLGAGWQTWLRLQHSVAPLSFHANAGRRERVTLADGSKLVLRAGARLQVSFDDNQRLLRLLAGEVAVATASDNHAPYRPLLVETRHGHITALGTRFTVGLASDRTCVAVQQHAVRLQPWSGGAGLILQAGEHGELSDSARRLPLPPDDTTPDWVSGRIVVVNARLGDVIRQLAPHYPGALLCDPQAAALPVSGAFSEDDPQASLQAITATLPVKIVRRGPLWTLLTRR